MIEITNEDNMKLMARYEDNHFDLAIVDPPYGIGMSDYKRTGNLKFDQSKKWDDAIPSKEYFNELIRVSKNQIVWGGNYFTEFLLPTKGWLFWNKKQQGNMQIGEMAWTSFDRMKYFERSWQLDRNWQIPGGKIHPTQKPVQLYKFILNDYANKGDKILDTHLGSGSIAMACHDYKFDLTACEIDTEHYNSATKRLKEAQMQTKLF